MGFNCWVWDQSLRKAEPVKWVGPSHPNWLGGRVPQGRSRGKLERNRWGGVEILEGAWPVNSTQCFTPPAFPAPLLTLSEPEAPEGKVVTVSCWAGVRALVTLEGISAAVPGQPAELWLNATENDDRRSFFCDAALKVDGETLRKNQSTELRVLCEWVFTLSL